MGVQECLVLKTLSFLLTGASEGYPLYVTPVPAVPDLS